MRLRNLLSLLALMAVPAMAQERTVMGGFQLGLAKFTGSSDNLYASNPVWSVKDMTDDTTGFEVGGHVSFNLQNGHMIRLRADLTTSSGTTNLYNGEFDATIATVGVMGEYLYHVNQTNQGFYLLVGAGLEATAVKIDDKYGYGSETSSKSTLAWDAGLGYQFTPHVGMDLRYASSHPTGFDYPSAVVSYDVKNDRFALGVNFSF